jgi:hypothetical protein
MRNFCETFGWKIGAGVLAAESALSSSRPAARNLICMIPLASLRFDSSGV